MVQGKNRTEKLVEFGTFSGVLLLAGSMSITLAAITREDRSVHWNTAVSILCLVGAAFILLSRRHAREPWIFVVIILLQVVVGALAATTSNDTFRAMDLGSLSGVGALAAWYFGTSPFRRGYLALFAVGVISVAGVAIWTAERPQDLIWAAGVSCSLALLIAIAVAKLRLVEDRLAHEDYLTGALNRRGMDKFLLDSRLERRRAAAVGLLLALDLDDFKGVNDAFGHTEGDRVLAGFAKVWRSSLRSGDCIARLGGDEFIVFLRGATENDLGSILERVSDEMPIRFSVGAVHFDTRQDFSEALQRADVALYSWKREQKKARGHD